MTNSRIKITKVIERLTRLTEQPLPKLSVTQSFDANPTVKMWILPDGEVVKLNCWHDEWLERNREMVWKKWGLKLANNLGSNRLPALHVGFVRINYTTNTGTFTVEANQKFFNRVKNTLMALIASNAAKIDNIAVNLFNDQGKVVKRGFEQVFKYDDKEKIKHIPFIHEAAKKSWNRGAFTRHET